MTRRKSLAALVGGAVLVLTVAGCSDPPQGTVMATNGRIVQTISNPPDQSCHLFAPIGVNTVRDNTLADMRLYRTVDCSGHNFYLSQFTEAGDSGVVYRSYSFVGQ